MVIPAMNRIDKVLTTQSLDSSCPSAIHESVHLAKKLLNKYYAKTDYSDMYRIAMGELSYADYITPSLLTQQMVVLHLRHKLKYF